MNEPTTINQFETIGLTEEFLNRLQENHRKNIFEVMKNISLNLDRPNMTETDVQNIKQAFEVLKNNWALTPQNISGLNDIMYYPDYIGIEELGILFDRNNLSWWKGIFNEETQERYYSDKMMMMTLKEQDKETFNTDDIRSLLEKTKLFHWWDFSSPRIWNILGIILWCKESWLIDKRWKLCEVNSSWYLRFKAHKFHNWLYYFNKAFGARSIDEGESNGCKFPVRAILRHSNII